METAAADWRAARGGSGRATIVAHSLGGILAFYWLQRQPARWRSRYVSRLVTLGTPWGGDVEQVAELSFVS